MKRKIIRTALLCAVFCVLICSCAPAVEPESFDTDFIGTASGIDLDGFELTYEYGIGNDSTIGDVILGFVANTNFADAAQQRIADVEKEYNCKVHINYEHKTASSENFLSSSLGGLFVCDVISGYADTCSHAARFGAVHGISTLADYIDYHDENKWGTRDALSVVYYNDDLYGVLPFSWPELCHTCFGYPIVVNEDIVQSLGQTDPREFAENGEWTWAKFRECLEAYTKIEGGETIHYGMSAHDAYFAQMFLLSNGSRIVKKNGSLYENGVSDERAMKAMQEAIDIYRGDLAYTIDKSTASSPDNAANMFVEGKAVMSAAGTWYIYGQDARISQKVADFGVLKWPVGPDVDPDYTFSIYENNNFCISFSVLSSAPEAAAMIINRIYDPLPGCEDAEAIKEYMAHSYFFDERDCDTFFDMYMAQEYNYVQYGLRALLIEYLSSASPVSTVIERNADKMQSIIDADVLPSVRGIEALWGE